MADTKSSANVPASGGSGGAAPTLGQRVVGLFRAPANGGVMKRKTSSTSRFIVGSITFILVAELLTYLIDYANVKFNLNLNQPILGAQASWFSWFFVINVVIILGLWILLNKMGFFPRDMWAPRNGTTSSTARGASSNGNGASSRNGASNNNANQIPGIGGTRTRAERRHTAAVAEAEAAAAAAKSRKKGNGAASTTTGKRGAVIEDVNATHDAAYDRAKAAQRQRMRRARR
jgi:hypothetical protein